MLISKTNARLSIDEHLQQRLSTPASHDEDRIIKTYIHNLSARAPCIIEQYMEETRFLLMSRMLGETKLELALISAFLETWRPKTQIFYLPCSEYTITLKDVALQLGLPIDGSIVTGVVRIDNYRPICHQLLGNVLDKFSGN
ncbi:hypothetical protein PVK06_011588 [Gossypium arboreum]|uniref:Aminotransferase-like plant mobile domain-containing protein n=1 Tax=Gossypium arboreum TaxID=29729 RepID=A0ABR0Q9J7_GOSAR|nr:hypothetical protein PVK06_011588 [Gossypium arboreum]